LKASPTQIVVGGSRDGKEFFPYQCAVRLVGLLGTALEEFRGNHAGFARYPKEFAEKLIEIL